MRDCGSRYRARKTAKKKIRQNAIRGYLSVMKTQNRIDRAQ